MLILNFFLLLNIRLKYLFISKFPKKHYQFFSASSAVLCQILLSQDSKTLKFLHSLNFLLNTFITKILQFGV